MKIQNAFKQLRRDGQPLRPTDNQQLRRILVEAMEDQIKLIELTDLFIKVFTWIIMMHFISVAVIIGIGSIDFLIVRSNHLYFNRISSFTFVLHIQIGSGNG